MSTRFGTLAKITGTDVVFDESGDIWPGVVARKEFEGFEATVVAGGGMIMVLVEDGGSQVEIIRHEYSAVRVDEAIGIEAEVF